MNNRNKIFVVLTFFLLILLAFNNQEEDSLDDGPRPTEDGESFNNLNVKVGKYWNNFTFIHITDLNWSVAASYDWCSGDGSWGNPYLVEN